MYNNHEQLLIDVQKKSKKIVSSVRDVKYLKEEIESTKGLIIGFNTLRRLFGFLKETTPNIATLNTLSKYLNFKSFDSYSTSKLNFDEWHFQQQLLLIQTSKTLTDKDIITINTGVLNNKNIVYLGYFIANLIQENNTAILNKVFKNIVVDTLTSSDLLQFATIITHAFYRVPKKKAMAIYNDLTKNQTFRDTVVLLYIDYSTLNGIYFNVLELVKKNSTRDSDLFFVSLMSFYKQFYTIKTLEIRYITPPENFNKFPPVLRGRYFAYKIMNSTPIEPALKRRLIIECKKKNVHLLIEEIIPALIIKQEYKVLSEISEIFYEDIFNEDNWSTKTTNSFFLIALSNINWHGNNIHTAKKNLELVEIEKAELSYYHYISLFYYHTKLKISHSGNDLKTNTEAYNSLKELVLKTGFIKFLEVTQKYVLN